MGSRNSKLRRRRRDGTPAHKHSEKASVNDLKSSAFSPSSAQKSQDLVTPCGDIMVDVKQL
eukprot:CAMPEP_0170184222 /NCGR_PEP_ID=MMETSP0040_2-20121228/33022_1 /TAXON_ID=641309 /ORGANISM="Lotharella oceanica, Strain CCMP622" /LENGTH=60 /DNA_ID=CAMNT_0010430201 /DNA_START=21 /DNA_END=199 /DNA_ORIENTATION=-